MAPKLSKGKGKEIAQASEDAPAKTSEKCPSGLSAVERARWKLLVNRSIQTPRFLDMNVYLPKYDLNDPEKMETQVLDLIDAAGMRKHAEVRCAGFRSIMLEFYSTFQLMDEGEEQVLVFKLKGKSKTVSLALLNDIFGFNAQWKFPTEDPSYSASGFWSSLVGSGPTD